LEGKVKTKTNKEKDKENNEVLNKKMDLLAGME